MEYLILAFGFLYGAYAALEMRRVFMGPRKICIGLGTKMASAIWGALLTALMVWLIASGLMPPMNWLFVVIAIMAFLGGLMNFSKIGHDDIIVRRPIDRLIYATISLLLAAMFFYIYRVAF